MKNDKTLTKHVGMRPGLSFKFLNQVYSTSNIENCLICCRAVDLSRPVYHHSMAARTRTSRGVALHICLKVFAN